MQGITKCHDVTQCHRKGCINTGDSAYPQRSCFSLTGTLTLSHRVRAQDVSAFRQEVATADDETVESRGAFGLPLVDHRNNILPLIPARR
jgi:hypothetical protein